MVGLAGGCWVCPVCVVRVGWGWAMSANAGAEQSKGGDYAAPSCSRQQLLARSDRAFIWWWWIDRQGVRLHRAGLPSVNNSTPGVRLLCAPCDLCGCCVCLRRSAAAASMVVCQILSAYGRRPAQSPSQNNACIRGAQVHVECSPPLSPSNRARKPCGIINKETRSLQKEERRRRGGRGGGCARASCCSFNCERIRGSRTLHGPPRSFGSIECPAAKYRHSGNSQTLRARLSINGT